MFFNVSPFFIKMKKNLKCSFCGRDKKDASILVSGMEAHICDQCVSQAVQIVKEEEAERNKFGAESGFNLLKPTEITDFLDQCNWSNRC